MRLAAEEKYGLYYSSRAYSANASCKETETYLRVPVLRAVGVERGSLATPQVDV